MWDELCGLTCILLKKSAGQIEFLSRLTRFDPPRSSLEPMIGRNSLPRSCINLNYKKLHVFNIRWKGKYMKHDDL